MKRIFRTFDVYNTESLEFHQFKALMKSTYKDLSDNDVLTMFQNFDTDKNNEISLEEFLNLISGFQTTREEQDKELLEAFYLYDEDKNGKINPDELFNVLKNIGHPVEKESIPKIINTFDEDNDGCISFEEFEKMMISDS